MKGTQGPLESYFLAVFAEELGSYSMSRQEFVVQSKNREHFLRISGSFLVRFIGQ
jgi:hypothetical protein